MLERVFPGDTEMARRMRELDWSRTVLGPVERWPQPLCTAVGLCLEGALPIVIWWGPKLGVLYNDDVRPLLGDRHPGALGEPGPDVFGERWDVIGPMLAEVVERAASPARDVVLRVPDPHGEPGDVHFSFSCSPIRDESGRAGGIFCPIVQTASAYALALEEERRRGAAVLAGQREALEAALRGAPLEASLGVLSRAASVRWGPAVRAAFYLADENGKMLHHVAGMPWEHARAVDGFAIGADSLAWGLATHTGEAVLTADVTREPRWAPWLWLAERFDYRGCWSFPILTVEGTNVGAMALYWRQPREATERDLELAGALTRSAGNIVLHARSQSTLAENQRRKDEFLAVLSHELRNPMAAVRTGVAVFKASELTDPVLLRFRDVIDRQVAHMARLLDDLLDVSRLSQGKIVLKVAPVSLSDALGAAIEASLPFIEQRQQTLSTDLVDQPIVLLGDHARLVQVFGNLLTNAAEYSPPRAPIHVSVGLEHDAAVVRVRDTGAGIAADALERIFDPFTQLDTAEELAPGGLGIGLALARRLVELHGGSLTAESAGVGRGSTFVVRLPLGDSRTAAAPAAPAPASARNTDVPKRRVLIADDNTDAADALAVLLSDHCETRAVYGGKAAVDEAERFRPEVVLLDLGMPDLHGLDVCRRVRAEPWGKDIVIVAVTGWGREQDREQTKAAGFDDHLVKPVDPDVLVELVRTVALPRPRAT